MMSDLTNERVLVRKTNDTLLYSQLVVTSCRLENIFGLNLYCLIYLPFMLFTFFKMINCPTLSIRFEGLGLVTRFCSKQVNKTDRLPYSIHAHSCVDFFFSSSFYQDISFNVWIIQYSATMFNRISKLRCTVKLQEPVLQFQSILVHTFVIL